MRDRRLSAAAMLAIVAFAPGWAQAAINSCLGREERRAVLASGQVMPLAAAIRTSHPRRRGEIIKARLCRGANGYVYMLTLLARDGKVTRATVDATTGAVTGSR